MTSPRTKGSPPGSPLASQAHYPYQQLTTFNMKPTEGWKRLRGWELFISFITNIFSSVSSDSSTLSHFSNKRVTSRLPPSKGALLVTNLKPHSAQRTYTYLSSHIRHQSTVAREQHLEILVSYRRPPFGWTTFFSSLILSPVPCIGTVSHFSEFRKKKIANREIKPKCLAIRSEKQSNSGLHLLR